jgi:uncharacterized membrane protein YccC
MRILATTPEANLARLPIALDLRAVSIAEGIRAALGVAGIVAADQWLHWPPLLEAALGALLTCLCDSGGPIRRRLPALLIFNALGVAFIILFGLARSSGLAVAVPLAVLGVFTCSFARVWGQAPLQVGNLLTVVLVLALDEPLRGQDALLRAEVFAAGSLWATLLTMVIWRVHPFRPARRAVADSYRSLARLAADMRGLLMADASPDAWEAHARGHRRAVRDSVERARTAVQDTLRVRGQASPRAFQALIRVETADQLFGALIALSDLLEAITLEGGRHQLRGAAEAMLRLLRPALVVIAEAIAADDPGLGRAASRRNPVGRLARMGATLDEIEAYGAADERLAPIVSAIVDRLRATIMLTAPEGGLAGALPGGDPPGDRLARVLSVGRANLNWRSPGFRHALRAATVAGPALAFTLSFSGRYQHWLTITLILTLQPFYALTWQRAVERIGGTVLGGMLAAVIALVCTTPLAISAAMFPLAVVAFAMRGVSYAAFIFCLTPLIVLLTEFSRPGTGELMIALVRALYTVSGGLLAVAGGLLLWPSWEPDRLRGELRAALEAHAAYAEAELDCLLGAAPPAAVDRARRMAGLASNTLETSISRALLEPRRSARPGLQRAMLVDAALRRMAGRLSVLQLDPHHADGMDPAALRAWRIWIGGTLRALAEGEQLAGKRPEGRVPDAVGRIAQQIEMLRAAPLMAE